MSEREHDQAHGHDYEGAHQEAHGAAPFLERNWGALVIAFGCVFVYILAHYNPTAN